MPEQSDSSLMDSFIKEGNTSSLEELFNRHSPWMRAMIASSLDDPEEANDLFQDVWLKIIRKTGDYRGGSVQAYFATLLRNQLYDKYRQNGRRTFESLDAADCDENEGETESTELPATGRSPGEEFLDKASAAEIRSIVRLLPYTLREVFLMRVEGELKFQEIAHELKLPLGTVLSRMRKAIHILRRKLENLYGKR